jgi:hypothetical protein
MSSDATNSSDPEKRVADDRPDFSPFSRAMARLTDTVNAPFLDQEPATVVDT